MKKLMMAKKGPLVRLVSLVMQIFVICPLLFLVLIIPTFAIADAANLEDKFLVFKIVFLLCNILYIIRNNIVKIYDNKIIMRLFLWEKKIVEFENISDLRIITYKELRTMMFNASSTDPLITNAFSFVIPMGNFVTFKNKFGRDVIIGVWSYKKLYQILNEHINVPVREDIENENLNASDTPSDNKKQDLKHKSEKLHVLNNGRGVYNMLVKMPLGEHIKMFFKYFYVTILAPLFYVLFFGWLCKHAEIGIPRFVWVILFMISSAVAYYRIISVRVDTEKSVIRLNLFNNSDKNVIKYNGLSNLGYVNDIAEIEQLKTDKSKFAIVTPYCENHIDKIVRFDLKNNISVAISVSDPETLYEVLNEASD